MITTEALTFADVWEQLGRVPLERIRWRPHPGTATERDLIHARHADTLCELIDGVLVEKAVGFRQSIVAGFIIEILRQFIVPRNLGLVVVADAMMRMSGGNVRLPDVAFISWARIPGGIVPDVPIAGFAPDLAIEVLSPSNTAAEMRRKRTDLFDSGCQLIWEVDIELRAITVYDAVDSMISLNGNQSLNGGTVLPGFTIPLRDLFAELDRSAS